jgi:hypothetical protein
MLSARSHCQPIMSRFLTVHEVVRNAVLAGQVGDCPSGGFSSCWFGVVE